MDFPRARTIAHRLEVLPSAGSTNAELRERLAVEPGGWPHLSVLLTDDQTAGRGRLDRSWSTPPGSALAISVLLRVEPIAERGWIPLIAGLAMSEAIAEQLPGHVVALKWPNDVLVGEAKICGILAEAMGDAVIVGTGINTAMTWEQAPVTTATSFAMLGAICDADRLLTRYLEGLERALARLHQGDAAALHAAVSAVCSTLGQEVRVILPDGERRGRAVRLGDDGRLVLDDGTTEHLIGAGDIVHLRPGSAG